MADDNVSDLVAFVHVSDMARSIGFYERLGLEVSARNEHEGQLDWVSLQSSAARLMLARASAPIDPHAQAVLFYLYTRDLTQLRERLLAAGVAAGEIRDGTPGPRREMGLSDPDGYCLMIAEIDAAG